MKSETGDLYLDDQTRSLLNKRDSQFLTDLFSEVNPYLLRICAANGIFKENAEEVIHDTWERFFTNLEKFEGRSQIRTFICGILFNKIREHRRSLGKTIYEEDSERVMSQAFTAEGWWKASPHDPHRLLELRQAGDLIQECLDGLSEQQKAAFVMREVEGENSESICNILNVSVSNLRVLLFRAKDKLRQCLEGKISAES